MCEDAYKYEHVPDYGREPHIARDGDFVGVSVDRGIADGELMSPESAVVLGEKLAYVGRLLLAAEEQGERRVP